MLPDITSDPWLERFILALSPEVTAAAITAITLTAITEPDRDRPSIATLLKAAKGSGAPSAPLLALFGYLAVPGSRGRTFVDVASPGSAAGPAYLGSDPELVVAFAIFRTIHGREPAMPVAAPGFPIH